MRSLILSSALLTAALLAPQAAVAQSPERPRPFCLQSPTGDLECSYDTMAQCREGTLGRSVGGGCIPNPQLGTTGGGGMQLQQDGQGRMDRPGSEPRR